jgi:hypothetical protein
MVRSGISPPFREHALKPRLTILLLLIALVGWLFWPALGGRASFAFRDAAHYYHPLFEYIRSEWGAGRLPLWNPYENIGVPLVAENTSSVFYPGKLLFALPLDYIWLYNAYLVLHVLLASATSYLLARHFRASVLGAGVAAISYAFCGNVLFQYCNVIYLVGAAWLPLAWLYVDRLLRLRQGQAAVGFGVVLALMVLGGDPHLAYNTAIVACGYAVLLWRDDRKAQAAGAPRVAIRRPLYLFAALAIAGLLAAIQVLPTLEAGPFSNRSKFDAPRNIYELAIAATSSSGEKGSGVRVSTLFGDSPRGHHAKIYHFSLEPWRLVELIWPNVTGRAFPTNRRWLTPFQAEFNIWTPSLYMGLLPVLLAALAFRMWRPAPVEVRGLSWLVLFGVLGSFGWYGIAWLAGTLVGASEDFSVGGEVGGLYWWLATFLPGYIQFRYPSKLFVLASLALSMLAARGWSLAWRPRRRFIIWLAAVPALSALAGGAALSGWTYFRQHVRNTEKDDWFGPFDWSGAWTDLGDGLLHGAILALALMVVWWVGIRWPRYRRLMQTAALVVVALDLGIAQRHLLEYAPAELWRQTPHAVSLVPNDPQYRVFRQLGTLPASFAASKSSQRFADLVRWGRDSLEPKYPLPYHVPMAGVLQTVAGDEFETLLDAARTHGRRTSGQGALPDASVLDLIAARTAIVADASQFSNPQEIAEGMFLSERPNSLPRAWIVHQIELRPPFRSRSIRAAQNHTMRLAFPERKPRNWGHVAIVESEETIDLPEPREGVAEGETCKITFAGPLRVEIAAKLNAAGLIVLSDQFYPGWELTVESAGSTRTLPILRANRLMRGALLPAGTHRLVYRYRPRSVLFGAIISGLTAAGLCGFAMMRWRRKTGSSGSHLVHFHLRNANSPARATALNAQAEGSGMIRVVN